MMSGKGNLQNQTNGDNFNSANHVVPVFMPTIMNSMDNLHGGGWPPVDYSLGGRTSNNMDTSSSSVILNVGPSQTMQLLPNVSHSSVSLASQMIHQQPMIGNPQLQHHSNHQLHIPQSSSQTIHHPSMISNNNSSGSHSNTASQIQVGQILPTILQQAQAPTMLVTNQQMAAASNMMWQTSATATHQHQQQQQQHQQQQQQQQQQVAQQIINSQLQPLPQDNHLQLHHQQQQQQQQIHQQNHSQVGNFLNPGGQMTSLDEIMFKKYHNVNTNTQLKLPAKKRRGKLTSDLQNHPEKKSKVHYNFLEEKPEKSKTISGGSKPVVKKAKKKQSDANKKKRSCNPDTWKKNVRKMNRVQGKGYINTKGVYVPPRTRSGPPCKCRMKCYENITEEECDEIFERFFQIGDKNIQDALLYSLITKEEVKSRTKNKGKKLKKGKEKKTEQKTEQPEKEEEVTESEIKQEKKVVRNATFLYHVQCKEGMLRVCNTAFGSIYGASQKRIRRLQQHKYIDMLNPPKDQRGKHGNQKIVGQLRAKKRRDPNADILAINLVKKEITKPSTTNSDVISKIVKRVVNDGASTSAVSFPEPQQHQEFVNGKPVDYSKWNTISSDAEMLLTASNSLPLQQAQLQPNENLNHDSINQQPPALPLPIEMNPLDSSSFLSGFLIGSTTDDHIKLAMARFNSSNTNSGVNNNFGSRNLDRELQQVGGSALELGDNDDSDGDNEPSNVAVEQLASQFGAQQVELISGNTNYISKFPLQDDTMPKKKPKKKNPNPKKRTRNPELWKKNVRKNNRAQGMAYVNTKGELVPAKTRSGPPCKCRMKCYTRISEEECNRIFHDFLKIGDKNVQDGILYNLMIHKGVRRRTKLMKKRKKKCDPLPTIDTIEDVKKERPGKKSKKRQPKKKQQKDKDTDTLHLITKEEPSSDGDADNSDNVIKDDEQKSSLASKTADKNSNNPENRLHNIILNLSTANSQQQEGENSDENDVVSSTNNGDNLEHVNENMAADFAETEETLSKETTENQSDHQEQLNPSGQNTKSQRDRQSTFLYYVQQTGGLTRVCGEAFKSIYGASQKRLRRLQTHKVKKSIAPPMDMRGKHGYVNTPKSRQSTPKSNKKHNSGSGNSGKGKTLKKTVAEYSVMTQPPPVTEPQINLPVHVGQHHALLLQESASVPNLLQSGLGLQQWGTLL